MGANVRRLPAVAPAPFRGSDRNGGKIPEWPVDWLSPEGFFLHYPFFDREGIETIFFFIILNGRFRFFPLSRLLILLLLLIA